MNDFKHVDIHCFKAGSFDGLHRYQALHDLRILHRDLKCGARQIEAKEASTGAIDGS